MDSFAGPVRPPRRTPQQITVASDGGRVVFLRDHRLWVYHVTRATARPVASGVTGYAIDRAARTAAFVVAGELHRADLASGRVGPVPGAAGPADDPRPDPTGTRIGYLAGGCLYITDGTEDLLLAGEPDPAYGGHPYVSWGRPDPAGQRYGRGRGWWWAPDGRTLLAARVDRSRARPAVSLHLLELDGSWVDVHWDRETYPYLAHVSWGEHGDPLVAVLRRPPPHGLVLAVDPRTGETQVHAELADARWVDPVPGTPCHLADGRVLVGGELAHDGYDARCLFADGTLLTPPSLYVRRVVGRVAGTPAILVEGSAGEPSEQHLFQVSTSAGAAGVDARRITTTPGWHRAVVGGDTLVVGSELPDRTGPRWTVHRAGALVGELVTPAGVPAAAPRTDPPRPQLARVTDRRLPTGVLYPRDHVSGRPLPVLVVAAGLDQQVRAVRADWAARQQWADLGAAVVAIDHRGTPGVAPSFEKVVHRRLADLALADLADALAALTGKHPDLDLGRVAVHGHGVGGWLAALAALRAPDRFRCALATAPVVDWHAHEPVLAERYLGLPGDAPPTGDGASGDSVLGEEAYLHHSLLAAVEHRPTGLPGRARPVLLAADPQAPDPVDQLARALAAAGHPHTVLPPTASPSQVRRAGRTFLRRHLLG